VPASNLYAAIANGALSAAVGMLTGGSNGLEALIARIAEPPIGYQLTLNEGRYLSAIAARANVSAARLVEGRKVWKQDIPILNAQPFANMEGGNAGEYNYRVVIKYNQNGQKRSLPLSFSSDRLLTREEMFDYVDVYIEDSVEKRSYGVDEQSDFGDATVVPVFMFRTSWK